MSEKEKRYELVVDHRIRAPAPLDPAIASTMLQAKSNRLTDGFPLSVSASFGTESVTLEGDGFTAEPIISMDKALMDVEFLNCMAYAIDKEDDGVSDEWLIEGEKSSSKTTANKMDFVLRANVGAKLDGKQSLGIETSADVRVGSENEKSAVRKIYRRRRNWRLLSSNSILIGSGGSVLDGREVDDFIGWNVTPAKSDQAFAVKCTLSTRVEWINFVEIPADSFTGRLGQHAKALFRSEDTYRKQMFAVLLRHLAARGLQQNDESKEAILAVDILVARPEQDVLFTAPSDPKTRRISLASGPLETFLTSEAGTEVETLIVLGIPVETLEAVQQEGGTVPKRSRGLFTAGSSPIGALKAYEATFHHAPLETNEWTKKHSERNLTDLKNLGLLKIWSGRVIPNDKNVSSPESMFRYAAARAKTIETTRAMLLRDPNVSSIELMDAISVKYGKKYTTDASKIRVGNALKRWARWLEPHLIDPTGGAASEIQMIGAKSKVQRVGPASFATEENLRFVDIRLEEGAPITQIARELGVVPQTLYNWRRRGLIR